MVKVKLNALLPASVLDSIIPAYEASLGSTCSIIVYDSDYQIVYGDGDAGAPAAPILIDHEEIGYVSAVAGTPSEAQAATTFMARVLSLLATEARRRQQLTDETLARYDELNLIYNLGASLVRGTPQEQIAQTVLLETNRIINADAGVIYLWDDQGSNLVPVSYFGEGCDLAFWQGRVRELALSTLYAYEEAQLFDADKLICAPLRSDEELLGALVLLHERDDKTFKANDLHLLTTLSTNTALFIYAAHLVERLEQRNAELEATLAELQATRDKLSQAERMSIIGQTVGGLFHDLKNPLNIILGYAGLLQEDDITLDERQQFAGQIIKYVGTISAMAQEILDYIQGDDSVGKAPIEVGAFIEQVRDLLMPPGIQRRVHIHFDTSAAQGYIINVDRRRFARVFQNLVSNAVDAIESQGGSQVIIEAQPVDGGIQFSVTDDGPGVPAQIVDTIFEPFVTFGKQHGTGLGLAIVTRMVTIHGGRIHYEPAPGGGARFVFTVPTYPQNGR